jgi:DNA replicative helicase MCM subunit Mcm2 (Cdc46/Mcm family)
MYARDRVHPQLHDTDSEKLMELYAHLRKESLATGSFPVTVRHFESTIRMAEASAKMHLRDVVTSSDINLAIKVTVGSFVSAQKMSIKKTLERVRSIAIICPPIITDRASFRRSGNTLYLRTTRKNLHRSFLDRW